MTSRDSSQPTLSLITVTWNHRGELEPYLAALEKSRAETSLQLEPIIVDNASSDGTAASIREQLPWAVVIENATNTGFALGCNIGLERATGEYLMLLNPDAFVNSKALEGMVAFLRDHPRAGAVGCTLLHDDGRPQISAYAPLGATSYLLNQSFIYPVLEKLKKLIALVIPPGRKPRRCGYLMGACIMLRRDVYTKVGGLEPSYFMYSEDADWGERIRRAGHDVVFLPHLTMEHRQKGSSRRAREFTFRRLYRSTVHYANRNLTGAAHRNLMLVMKLDMTLRIPIYWVLSLALPGRREALRERIRSVRRLLAIIDARDPDLFEDPPPR